MSYTALAAGPVALLIAVLGIAISLSRLARRASGPGFHGLQRAHGNACEHTPLLLILLFLAETLHSPHWVLVLGAWGITAAGRTRSSSSAPGSPTPWRSASG
jgi:uncharacterized membrane protein YecN with MAPEG domain